MRKILISSIIMILISGCTTSQVQPSTFTAGRQVIQRPALIQVPEQKTNFRLMYGNDSSLERAFNQYTKTGNAPNIITDGFVKFAFNAGQQPIIQTTPFQETVISLEPKEKFTNISSGDPNRWSYLVAVSGSGDSLQQHVLVKPSLPDISTNMVITTNKRIYNLKLISLMNEKSIKNISFWYPDEMVGVINEISIKQIEDTRVASVPDVNLNNLNFNYSISCGWFCRAPNWSPTRVFDDGTHTYIQFSKEISNRDMPVLFVSDKNSKELVNYRFKSPYFVVDKIFKQAVLVMGVGQSQRSVTLTNNRYS